MRAVSIKVSYLTKKQTSDDEVRRRPPLGVHWDESRWLRQLHSHVLHLAIAQHPQQSLQRGSVNEQMSRRVLCRDDLPAAAEAVTQVVRIQEASWTC